MSTAPGPLVSAIMPVYNGERYLRAALDSILAQTYEAVEIVAVDDGSIDGSGAILDQYASRMTIVREGRGGNAGIARRKGIAHARGVYFAFLDQDDLWLPGKLAAQVAFMEARPHVGLSFTSFQILQHDACQHRDFYAERPHVRRDADLASLFQENSIYMPTPMIRRRVYDEVGGFDARLMGTDDYHLWLKAAVVSRIGFLPEVLGVYRLHDANNSNQHARMLENEFLALSLLVEEYPAVRERLGAGVVRARLADQAYRAAYRLRECGHPREAVLWLGKAVKANPTDARLLLIYLKYALRAMGMLPARQADS